MPLALQEYTAPYGSSFDAKRERRIGKAVFTAQTYTAGGILPVYPGVTAAGTQVLVPTYNGTNVPDTMAVYSVAGTTPGYTYIWVKSTGKVMIQQAGTEIAAAALPAAVIADVVEYQAEWVRI